MTGEGQPAAEAPGAAASWSQSNLRGIGFRLLSAGSFTVMLALVKLASARGVSTPEIVFYRNTLSLPFLLIWVAAVPGLETLRTTRPGAHASRSLVGLVSMALTFQAMAMLPLATATTLTFMSPLFAALLSPLILNERVGWRRGVAIMIGFSGVLFVLNPGQAGTTGVTTLGVMVGVMAALAQVGVAITVRQLQMSERVLTTVFWLMLFSALVAGLSLPFFGQLHAPEIYGLLLAMSTFGLAGQLFMTASLTAAPVSVVLPFDYFQILGSVLLGWVLFSTIPTGLEIVGAAVIVGAGLYMITEHSGAGRIARLLAWSRRRPRGQEGD